MRVGPLQGNNPFSQTHQTGDILRKKSGGGHLIFFGIPFILTGFLAMLVVVELVSNQSAEFEIPSAAAFLSGVIFLGLGLVLTLGRSGLTLDRRRNRLTLWRKLIFTLHRTDHPLDQIDCVRLHCGTKGNGKLYRIELQGNRPMVSIIVKETACYPQARRIAEELARFLGKPLTDPLK